MQSSFFFACLSEEQVVHVRDADLRGEARIDGAAAGAFAIQLAARVVRVDDVAAGDAETLEVAVEERRVRVHVQHARDADPQRACAARISVAALARRPRPRALRNRIGTRSRHCAARTLLRRDLDEVRVGLLDRVDARLDAAHRVRRLRRVPFSHVAMISRRSSSAFGTFEMNFTRSPDRWAALHPDTCGPRAPRRRSPARRRSSAAW